MAHSSHPEPDAPRPVRRVDGPHQAQPREQDAPRPLIVLMIISLLLLVAVAYYAIEQSGLADNVMGHPTPFSLDDPIMDLDELLQESEKRNLLGRDVALWNVPVERVAGDYTFWVGFDEERRVPVVLLGERTSRQYETQTAVHRGDTLAIFGTIRSVREVRRLDKTWAMQEEEWERLDRAIVYVSALRVEHLARAERAVSPAEADGR